MSDMTWLVILPLLLVIYFIPTIVAAERRQHNLSAIFALNLLLGWTFVWWAIALVWILTKTSPTRQPDLLNVADFLNAAKKAKTD
jgi:hypothetical protein